ncbi:hypothetical protein BCP12_167 [Bacillus phage BCP12]|uniref:Uncharacterized protein n=1 Tax=Bacillus phage BCP12 TaxID=1913122 RepID=A0A2S0CST3_9CAUD|nr:hypothetical protein BCP12_167 [Bacillus phage BCP12]
MFRSASVYVTTHVKIWLFIVVKFDLIDSTFAVVPGDPVGNEYDSR